MQRLGISIYPDKSNKDEMFDYMKRASEIGASRIFSCLLSAKGTAEEIEREYKEITDYAHSLGYEIIFDVNPQVLEKLGVKHSDLGFFKRMGADGIRLDGVYNGIIESMMTFNKEGLYIELNMAWDSGYLDNIMSFMPNRNRLIGCSNFYPHIYSGAGIDFFERAASNFRSHGLRTACFITSQEENTFGPWPVSQGLPTLECHRFLPIDVQLKHLIALDLVDDIIISNCYPSAEELASLASLPFDYPVFNVVEEEGIGEVEQEILYDGIHMVRGDITPYMIRSSESRTKFKDHEFTPYNVKDRINRGDVLVDNSNLAHYAGEMQIALTDMDNLAGASVVGHIAEDELFILDALKPWQKYGLRKA